MDAIVEVTSDDQLVRQAEGYRLVAYLDNKLIWTVGIGFNLETQGARAALEACEIDPEPIYTAIKEAERAAGGKVKGLTTHEEVIDDIEAENLFSYAMNQARKDIRKLVPNYDEHPPGVKAVLIDLLYNMGLTRLAKFTHTLGYVISKQYARAGNNLVLNPQYVHDVGTRATRNEAILCAAQSWAGPAIA